MQFLITKTIAVEAETPEEAVSKIGEGKTVSFNVSPRPTPQAQARPAGMPAVSPALAARQAGQ